MPLRFLTCEFYPAFNAWTSPPTSLKCEFPCHSLFLSPDFSVRLKWFLSANLQVQVLHLGKINLTHISCKIASRAVIICSKILDMWVFLLISGVSNQQPFDFQVKFSFLLILRCDSVFFVLKKKFGHLSFLHVLHHGIMPFETWWGVRFESS